MRLLLFILLKVLEIGTVIFVPYYLGKLIFDIDEKFMCWLMGIAILILTIGIVIISPLLWEAINYFIEFNWSLVNKILN